MELAHEYKYVYGLGLIRVDDKRPDLLAEKLEMDFTDYGPYDYDYDDDNY